MKLFQDKSLDWSDILAYVYGAALAVGSISSIIYILIGVFK